MKTYCNLNRLIMQFLNLSHLDNLSICLKAGLFFFTVSFGISIGPVIAALIYNFLK